MYYFYLILSIFIVNFWIETLCHKARRGGGEGDATAMREVENRVVMDLGAVGAWYEPPITSKKIVMVLYDEDKMTSLRIFDKKLFPDHHVLLIRVSFSNVATATAEEEEVNRLCDAYECMLRYERWDRIVLIGMGRGAMMTSVLYRACQTEHLRLPSLLIHINGVYSVEAMWWLEKFVYRILWGTACSVLEGNVSKNYKDLMTPLLIFHSKNNKTHPFMDSILLFRDLVKNQGCRHCTMIPLYGNEDAVLLSKENQRLIQMALARIPTI
jgi:hypothetical protein